MTPNLSCQNSLFGLSFSEEEAQVLVLPVPWDVTCSFRRGTAYSPALIQELSSQIDLYHPLYNDVWKKGIHLLSHPAECLSKNETLSPTAIQCISDFDHGREQDSSHLRQLNQACQELITTVSKTIESIVNKKKFPVLLGGDHSLSLGAIQGLKKQYQGDGIGILQLDAHMDLRHNYQGFTHSHASVMAQAIQEHHVTQLVQVGVRDFCEEEVNTTQSDACDVVSFTDGAIQENLFLGDTWHDLCQKILEPLPKKVYVSFDMDVLNPGLCPNTGTPVPGGLDTSQCLYLVQQVMQTGREVVGLDLVEVGHDSFDCGLASHLLYQLILRTSS